MLYIPFFLRSVSFISFILHSLLHTRAYIIMQTLKPFTALHCLTPVSAP